MKHVLTAAFIATLAVGSMTHQAAAEQVCYDLPAVDNVYVADSAAADEVRRVALEAADEELRVQIEEADKLLDMVTELRAAFKAADQEGYVEFLVAEDAGVPIDPATMSAAYRDFVEQWSTAYAAWNEAKSAAYATWREAKSQAYKAHNEAMVAAMDELNKRQLP
jgi:hypothetical protein